MKNFALAILLMLAAFSSKDPVSANVPAPAGADCASGLDACYRGCQAVRSPTEACFVNCDRDFYRCIER